MNEWLKAELKPKDKIAQGFESDKDNTTCCACLANTAWKRWMNECVEWIHQGVSGYVEEGDMILQCCDGGGGGR